MPPGAGSQKLSRASRVCVGPRSRRCVWLHPLARIQTAGGFTLGHAAARFRLALGLRLSNPHLCLAGLVGGFRLGLPSFLIGLLGGFLGSLVQVASLHSTLGPTILAASAIIGPAVLTPVAIAAGGRTGPIVTATIVTAHAVVPGPVAAAIVTGTAAAGVAAATSAAAATAAATPSTSTAPSTATAVPSAPTVLGVGDACFAVAGCSLQVCQERHNGKSHYRNRDVPDEPLHSHFLVLLRG